MTVEQDSESTVCGSGSDVWGSRASVVCDNMRANVWGSGSTVWGNKSCVVTARAQCGDSMCVVWCSRISVV